MAYFLTYKLTLHSFKILPYSFNIPSTFLEYFSHIPSIFLQNAFLFTSVHGLLFFYQLMSSILFNKPTLHSFNILPYYFNIPPTFLQYAINIIFCSHLCLSYFFFYQLIPSFLINKPIWNSLNTFLYFFNIFQYSSHIPSIFLQYTSSIYFSFRISAYLAFFFYQLMSSFVIKKPNLSFVQYTSIFLLYSNHISSIYFSFHVCAFHTFFLYQLSRCLLLINQPGIRSIYFHIPSIILQYSPPHSFNIPPTFLQ